MFESLPLEILEYNTKGKEVVPDSIGEIRWYGSTFAKDTQPKNAISKYIQLILSVLICVLSWIYLTSVDVYIPMGITPICIIWFAFAFTKGDGKDYFIGENGFSVVKYKNYRNNISWQKTILFKDVKDIFVGETKIYKDDKYERTELMFSVYGNDTGRDKKEVYPLIYTEESSYLEDKELQGKEHDLFPGYIFCKEIEEILNNEFIARNLNNKEIEFKVTESSLHRNTIVNKLMDEFIKQKGIGVYSLSQKNLRSIVVKSDTLVIDGCEYNLNCLKDLVIYKGFLVIEHENHKRKLMGLADKGDTHSIQLNGVGHMQAFLKILGNRIQAQILVR